MNERSAKLFFLELILMLLSFALCAVVCIRIFANAHRISAQSRQTSAAIVKAQTAAETFKASAWTDAGALLGADTQGNRIIVYYDPSWQTVKGTSERMLTMLVDSDGMLQTALITVSLDGNILFALTACRPALGGTAP